MAPVIVNATCSNICGEPDVVLENAKPVIRILMVSSYPLFGQGIERLLCHESELEIVGTETDPDRAMERIVELRPDVVILDSADPTGKAMPIVMRILKERWATKVIGLNPHDNTICVYRQERRTVEGVTDLIRAIKQVPDLWQ